MTTIPKTSQLFAPRRLKPVSKLDLKSAILGDLVCGLYCSEGCPTCQCLDWSTTVDDVIAQLVPSAFDREVDEWFAEKEGGM